MRKASVKKNAVTDDSVLQASPRRYRTFRIVMAARYPRFARMRAAVCHRRVMLRCMRPLWREAADFRDVSIWSISERAEIGRVNVARPWPVGSGTQTKRRDPPRFVHRSTGVMLPPQFGVATGTRLARGQFRIIFL